MQGREVRCAFPLALVLQLAAVSALAAQPGQYAGQGLRYNPYTGRGGDSAGYNPYTRTAPQAAAGYNPYTGANRAAVAAPNPYTGAPSGTWNALTGRFGKRGDNRAPPGSARRQTPVTGKIGPGLGPLDNVMLGLLEKHGIPGGALALVKDGKLVLARGYGWSNLANGAPVTPDAVFGVASLSKTLTAVAVLKLVDEGKLKLEDRVFGVLSHLRAPPGARVDPRMIGITIRQLLNHSGGWDRTKSGEPWSFSWRVARRLHVPLPISNDQLARYMLGEKLDFAPGTQQQYSNYGYMLLGQVIEKVSGLAYGEYVAQRVLKPMGLRNARLPGNYRGYNSDEVRLYAPGTLQQVSSDFIGPLGDAAGGWRSSVVDLARFLAALDGSRGKPFLSAAMRKEMLANPPPPLVSSPERPHVGLGWDAVGTKKGGTGYFKDGLLPGCRAFMGRTPAGVNYVLLFNSGEKLTPAEIESELHPRHGVERSIRDTIKWPEVDYFDSFR